MKLRVSTLALCILLPSVIQAKVDFVTVRVCRDSNFNKLAEEDIHSKLNVVLLRELRKRKLKNVYNIFYHMIEGSTYRRINGCAIATAWIEEG